MKSDNRSPSPRRAAAVVTLGLCMLAVSSCCTGPDVPMWLDNPPLDDTYLYATGSYVGSLYPEDNRKNALKAGIANLSAQIKTRVKDRLVLKHSGSSQSIERRAELIADNAVQNSQPVAYWVDWDGLVKDGVPGTVYVLVRAPMPSAE